MYSPDKIRNVAIVAHIDHGKTTLMDGLLKQSNVFRDNQQVQERVMDSYDQERERGITIFAKHTSIYYQDYKINLIDTPGHADFSGEVERVLGMVNAVVLIVDAQDGPMPQTRFVLSKSLKMGLRPVVVLNKIDKPNADPERVLNETFDLFVELGATDEQLDFSYCYASAIKGYAQSSLDQESSDFAPLFDLLINATPAPKGDLKRPFLFQAASLSYNDFVGRQGCGRIARGTVRKGQRLIHVSREGVETPGVVQKIEGYLGLQKVEMDEAGVGDIVVLSGFPEITIGDCLCDPEDVTSLPPIHLDEPTVSVDIQVNSGPFVGKSGKHVTMNKIRERLLKEQRANISYKILEMENEASDKQITVAGRGELHLAVLFEQLRREGYEFCISKPKVIVKTIEGQKQEPFEKARVEVPEEYSGAVIEQLSKRKGEMLSLLTDEQGITEMEFLIPTRGLMGYRSDFLTTTRGLGILASAFEKYAPWKGEIPSRKNGVLISICAGKATAYACFNLESRGTLFIGPGEEVYEGMIVGEHARENDLIVNIVKGKQLTNVRASGSDENIILTPPRVFNLESAIGYIEEDELLEITPDALRFRKRYLTEAQRVKESRGK
jgi:GTP-binding protein